MLSPFLHFDDADRGPGGGLNKTTTDSIAYHRRIVYAMDTTAVLSLQLSSMAIVSQNVRTKIEFPEVVQDTLSADTLANLVSLAGVALPANADSVVFDLWLYGKDAGKLSNTGSSSLPIAFKATAASSGIPPVSRAAGVVPVDGVSRQKVRIALPLQTLKGQVVSLVPELENLHSGKARGFLLHVYEAIDESQAPKAASPLVVNDDERSRALLRVHPNPFTPLDSVV